MSRFNKIALSVGATVATAAAGYLAKKLLTRLVAPASRPTAPVPSALVDDARMARMSRKARKQHRAAMMAASAPNH